MRIAAAVLFVTGCGLSVVGISEPDGVDASVPDASATTTTDAPPPVDDADSSAPDATVDAGPCPGGCHAWEACEDACVDVASVLSGFRYEIPCTNDGRPTCSIATGTLADKSVTMRGTVGKTYDIVVRFRGVVEQRAYAGDTPSPTATGTNHEFFAQGGSETPNGDDWNIYALRISAPAFSWHLNSGVSNDFFSDPIDYQATIRVAGGATLTVHADSFDPAMVNNQDSNNQPIVIASLENTAFPGQFVQLDPISVAVTSH